MFNLFSDRMKLYNCELFFGLDFSFSNETVAVSFNPSSLSSHDMTPFAFALLTVLSPRSGGGRRGEEGKGTFF